MQDELDRIIQERVALGMPELLLAIADYFYCLGAGLIPPPPRSARPGLIALMTSLERIHRTEVLAPRGWAGPPPSGDDLPGWLLSLSSQADTIEESRRMEGPPAIEGWPV